MRLTSPTVRLLGGWALSALVFGMLALVIAGQFWWANPGAPFNWVETARRANRDWLPWAAVTPLIFMLVARWPLFGPAWKIAVPLHLLCAAGVFWVCLWWNEYVGPVRMPPPHGENWSGRPWGNRPPGPPRRNQFNIFAIVAFRLPTYLAVLGVAHALFFYRRGQARERRSLELESGLATARLAALRMQLQPHFLFNSLNAIAALIHKDPEAADEMVSALSDFLRLTLESSEEQELPLRRELVFVERYLAIEKVRFGERLKFAIDTPAETLPALVPTLVLQPLVENAVRHGLEPKVHGGSLTITARHTQGQLVLTVRDDGAGLHQPEPREGIGLHNTRARLSELYGKAATLEMRNGDGVRVEITLPFHTAALAP